MNKEETKKQIIEIINTHNRTEKLLKEVVFSYAKMEGLVSASAEDVDSFPYKKIIRQEFGLVI